MKWFLDVGGGGGKRYSIYLWVLMRVSFKSSTASVGDGTGYFGVVH